MEMYRKITTLDVLPRLAVINLSMQSCAQVIAKIISAPLGSRWDLLCQACDFCHSSVTEKGNKGDGNECVQKLLIIMGCKNLSSITREMREVDIKGVTSRHIT